MGTPSLGRVTHAHLIQPQVQWEDKEANHEHIRQLLDPLIDEDRIKAGDMLLLPEMFDTGFSFNVARTNDKDSRTLAFLLELAEATGAMVAGGRTLAACWREACAARNLLTVVRGPGHAAHAGEGRVVADYAKSYLFSPAGEQERFEAGSEVTIVEWGEAANLRVQLAICYDLRFPELFRAGVSRGSEAIALGACWPSVRQHHWRSLLMARAIENQAIVLGVNRVGDDPARSDGAPGLHYAGGTIAIGPKGDVLGELDDAPGVLSVPIDAESVRAWRAAFPALRDMRRS